MNLISLEIANAMSSWVVMAAKRMEPVFVWYEWIEVFEAIVSLGRISLGRSSSIISVSGSLPIKSTLN